MALAGMSHLRAEGSAALDFAAVSGRRYAPYVPASSPGLGAAGTHSRSHCARTIGPLKGVAASVERMSSATARQFALTHATSNIAPWTQRYVLAQSTRAQHSSALAQAVAS